MFWTRSLPQTFESWGWQHGAADACRIGAGSTSQDDVHANRLDGTCDIVCLFVISTCLNIYWFSSVFNAVCVCVCACAIACKNTSHTRTCTSIISIGCESIACSPNASIYCFIIAHLSFIPLCCLHLLSLTHMFSVLLQYLCGAGFHRLNVLDWPWRDTVHDHACSRCNDCSNGIRGTISKSQRDGPEELVQ